jgi:hypothetical protein
VADDASCEARELLADAAAALAARAVLDELLVDALTAPDVGRDETARVVDYVATGALERGAEALHRVRERVGAGWEPS